MVAVVPVPVPVPVTWQGRLARAGDGQRLSEGSGEPGGAGVPTPPCGRS